MPRFLIEVPHESEVVACARAVKVLLEDGSIVLGVLGEPFLCEGKVEITAHGGWRTYIATRKPAAER